MEDNREGWNPGTMTEAEGLLSEDPNIVINQKLRRFFDGKIVRKDLTKKIK